MQSLKRIALAGLCALALWSRPACAAPKLEIVSAALDAVSPCAGGTYTLSVTLRDLVDAPAFSPYLYAAEEPSADFSSDRKGFSTDWNPPYFWWDIDANTKPSAPTVLSSRMGWPNDGGWEAPVSLSYTGQTYTQDFQVRIGATDSAATAYQIHLGASSGIQGSSGADAYYSLGFTTCSDPGAARPSATATPGPLPAAGGAKASETVRPNIVKRGGDVIIAVVSAVGGGGKLRILRPNGEVLQTLWKGTLAPRQAAKIAWDTALDDGNPAPGGLYYAVFTDGNGKSVSQKLTIIE